MLLSFAVMMQVRKLPQVQPDKIAALGYEPPRPVLGCTFHAACYVSPVLEVSYMAVTFEKMLLNTYKDRVCTFMLPPLQVLLWRRRGGRICAAVAQHARPAG